ncbi:MAG: hypothetical protein HC902_04485 [Calothrix sp. SM1_5_4]|nr:hypothetical protein [Calothrix sp. SM1_5_4]
MRFTNGHSIYVLGHIHGDRELPFILDRIVNENQAQMPDTDFLARMESLALSARPAAAHFAEDANRLRDFLTARPDVSFLAVEMTQSTWRNNLENYALLHDSFKEAFRARGLAPSDAVANLPRVAMGPIAYLKLYEPESVEGRDILGLESESATVASEKASADADAPWRNCTASAPRTRPSSRMSAEPTSSFGCFTISTLPSAMKRPFYLNSIRTRFPLRCEPPRSLGSSCGSKR